MKKKKKIGIVLLIVLAIIIITILGKVWNSNNKISSFSYKYGSTNSGYYNYEIKEKNRKITYIAKGTDGVKLNVNKEINNSDLSKLEKIINENNIDKWNGFNKENKKEEEDYNFRLQIKYKNGKRIIAKGYMRFPENYQEVHSKLTSYLVSMNSKAKETE